MRKLFLSLLALGLAATLSAAPRGKKAARPIPTGSPYVTISGTNLLRPDGTRLFIQGTNLGNWLNPEGYMFGFKRTNSVWMIDQALREMVGPDATDDFWTDYKDNYITRADIQFIAQTGSNTVRLPFHYKLFTNEDFMGRVDNQDGFERIDSLIEWCKESNLYLILDMHDCPGGQTGDNIDDGYGYPWLFESERAQELFCNIWRRIAERYKDETTILAYEPMNEPIAHYFSDKEELNQRLEPLYKKVVAAIREVDQQHIVMLGGAQWNGNFDVFTDWKFDDKIMYTCHRYGGWPGKEAFMNIIEFRDKTGLPMYMGETGHNTIDWQEKISTMMLENNIGYTFWPYKKLDNECMNAIQRPADWDSLVVKFAETPRGTFDEIRAARPNQGRARQVLRQFLENIKAANCRPQDAYIRSMQIGKAPKEND